MVDSQHVDHDSQFEVEEEHDISASTLAPPQRKSKRKAESGVVPHTSFVPPGTAYLGFKRGIKKISDNTELKFRVTVTVEGDTERTREYNTPKSSKQVLKA